MANEHLSILHPQGLHCPGTPAPLKGVKCTSGQQPQTKGPFPRLCRASTNACWQTLEEHKWWSVFSQAVTEVFQSTQKNRANSSRGVTMYHISWLWVKWKSKIVHNWEIHTISPKQLLWTWTTWRVHIPASHHMGAHEASFHFLVFHILQELGCLGGICSPDWLMGSNFMGKERR